MNTQKNKRAGAESKSNNKPFLNIRMLEPVQKKFSISKESDQVLQSYIHFYNNINNEKKYTESSVIEALIETLTQDKFFLKWYETASVKSEIIKSNHVEEEKTL